MIRNLFVFLLTALVSCVSIDSFAQFHLNAGVRSGLSMIDDNYEPMSDVRKRGALMSKGFSFGVDAEVSYDLRKGFSLGSGLSYDRIGAKEGSDVQTYEVWDVDESEIPFGRHPSTPEEHEIYWAFLKEHCSYRQIQSVSKVHISTITLPIRLNYTDSICSWLAIRPSIGFGNSFIVKKDLNKQNVLEPVGFKYKSYVPVVLGGFDVVLFRRCILGVQYRRDLASWGHPDVEEYGENLKSWQLSFKLAYRIF